MYFVKEFTNVFLKGSTNVFLKGSKTDFFLNCMNCIFLIKSHDIRFILYYRKFSASRALKNV